jgi:predicted secreted protein
METLAIYVAIFIVGYILFRILAISSRRDTDAEKNCKGPVDKRPPHRSGM